jgi:glutamate racemase
MNKNGTIGFFDAGMGGISVLARAMEKMPNESYVYLGDSINQPYTDLPKDKLRSLCVENCKFLVEKGAKAIVVACNTATMVAIDDMRAAVDVPILGMWPAIKPAVEMEKIGNGKVIVMATETTLSSSTVSNLIKTHGEGSRIYKLACPQVISLVEKGIVEGDEMDELIKDYFRGFNLDESTTVVLGCTHFGFLGDTMKRVLGKNVKIADGGIGVTNKLIEILLDKDMLCTQCKSSCEVYNSAGEDKVSISEKLLNDFLNILNKSMKV